MSRSGRIAIVLGMLAVVVFLVVFTAMSFVGSEPPTVNLTAGHVPGRPVHLVLQTDGAVGVGPHPTWVGYQAKDPATGAWVQTGLWQVPAHTKLDVTIYQFDSGSALRNQNWGRVTGVSATLNTAPFGLIDSNKVPVGHTFSIPALGISVPLKGVNTSLKNFCTAGPCNPATQAHNTITFSITTPGPGSYHWQCFIPCGLGFLYGNGGPMQTEGFMGGFLEVMA